MGIDHISLTVMTYGEWQSWKRECCYTTSWAKYDRACFVKANEVVQKFDIAKYKKIQVNSQAMVSEVIEEARKHFAGFDKNSRKPTTFMRDKLPDCDYEISYALYHPATGDEAIQKNTKISELGIFEEELVVIRQTYHEPHYSQNCMAFVRHFEDFQRIVLKSGNSFRSRDISFGLDNTRFHAILLYTDEDDALAKYVREHSDKLHQMSGLDITVYVVEAPHGKIHASAYWKAKLEQKAYFAWSLLGWTQSRPYDKSATYEIARSIGVYPNEFPCVVISHKSDHKDKITLPISSDFPKFFRNMFTSMQRSVPDLEKGSFLDRHELFSQIRKYMEQIQKNEPVEKISIERIIIMSDKPAINFNQGNATIGVNYAAEGSHIQFTQNTSTALDPEIKSTLADLNFLLLELQQKHPQASQEEAMMLIDAEFSEIETNQPQRWQNFLNLKHQWNGVKKALLKAGEHLAEDTVWGKAAIGYLEGVTDKVDE
jgi:hypothetical protein